MIRPPASVKSQTIVTAKAKVVISFEVDNLGTWGEECPISLVVRQARTAAERRAREIASGLSEGSVEIADITITEVSV